LRCVAVLVAGAGEERLGGALGWFAAGVDTSEALDPLESAFTIFLNPSSSLVHSGFLGHDRATYLFKCQSESGKAFGTENQLTPRGQSAIVRDRALYRAALG
jgi:hypothetical protein